MTLKLLVAVCLLNLFYDSARADIRYTFDQHIGFTSWNSGYGLSGTITTDGSTGILKSLDFIKDWNMTVKTRFSVDGIALQTLTPMNSLISMTLNDSAGLIVTTESITLAPSSLGSSLTWATLPADIELSFRTGPRGGQLDIADASEPDGHIGVGALRNGGAAIASGGVTVPEPSAAAYFIGIVIAVCCPPQRSLRPSKLLS